MEFQIKMYRIQQKDLRIKIPCEECLKNGIVSRTCKKCGGKGIHNKTIKMWAITSHTEIIEKIDRSSKDYFCYDTQTSYPKGSLRYWTSMSEFFYEEDKLLHFTKEDAQKECDERNKDIANILKKVDKNFERVSNEETESNVDLTTFILERKLEIEQARSNYWKLKANGETLNFVGFPDEIQEYIMS